MSLSTLTQMPGVLVYSLWGQRNLCGCGHEGKRKTIVDVFGQSVVLDLDKYGYHWCANCLQKKIIQCANCGKLIFPNDAIGLYILTDRTAIPPHAISFLNKEHVQLICCHRSSCASNITDQVARWVMPGKVEQIELLMDRLLAGNDRDNEKF